MNKNNFNVDFSSLAELDLSSFDIRDNSDLDTWLQSNCTFSHTDAYEFIHHLYQDQTEEWFIANKLSEAKEFLPKNIVDAILHARRKGADRICFYM